MLKFLKNIARSTIVGFLLISVSGLTLAIHHEHTIGGTLPENEHSQRDGLVVNSTPAAYHEVHFVKLLSGDSFNGSQKIEFKTSLVQLFTVHLDPLELSPIHRSTSLARIDLKDTGPPSVDKCILNCSFLI